MKDATAEELRSRRPDVTARHAIDFCLFQLLHMDKKHKLSDTVGGDCTYEELIGALLLAEDLTKKHRTRWRTKRQCSKS